jgi:hypothetical protein
MIRAGVFVMLLSAGLCACSADSGVDVRAEVERRIAPDMDAAQAISSLEQAGFICVEEPGSRGEVPDIRCSRSRSHRLIATCVQHVILQRRPDSAGRLAVTVPEPFCTGL